MMEEDDIISVSGKNMPAHSYYGKWHGGLCDYEN